MLYNVTLSLIQRLLATYSTANLLMAWNEPKDQKSQDYDPWTGQPKKTNTTNKATPPLIEDLLKLIWQKIAGVGNGSKKFTQLPAKHWAFLVSALLLGLWFALGLFQINANQEALVFRFGVFSESLGTGFYWRPWGVDSVWRFDREEKISQILATDVITQDANLAHIAIKLGYHVNNPKHYILQYHDAQQLVKTIGASVLQQTAANNKLDTILANAKNNMFTAQLQKNIAHVLVDSHLGVQLDQVQLVTIAVPDSIKATFDKINGLYEQQAKQKQQAVDYERLHMPAAEAKVVAQIAEANASAQQAKLNAQQEVSEFLASYPVYEKAPQLTRYQLYSQTMQEILSKTTHIVVDEKANGVGFYLPTSMNQAAGGVPAVSAAKVAEAVHAADPLTNSVDDSYGNVQGGY